MDYSQLDQKDVFIRFAKNLRLSSVHISMGSEAKTDIKSKIYFLVRLRKLF
jgi:hypothetical protein